MRQVQVWALTKLRNGLRSGMARKHVWLVLTFTVSYRKWEHDYSHLRWSGWDSYLKNPLGPLFRGLWWSIVGVPQTDVDYYGRGGPYLASKSKLPAAGWLWVVVYLILFGGLMAGLVLAAFGGGK